MKTPGLFDGQRSQMTDSIAQTADTLNAYAELEAERDKLLAFKAYVHRRLDEAGVTADPEGPHKAEGCRIGGRLDEVLAERESLRAANLALAERVAAQSELLGRRPEAAPAPGR